MDAATCGSKLRRQPAIMPAACVGQQLPSGQARSTSHASSLSDHQRQVRVLALARIHAAVPAA
eukprot:8030340-Heterocapsa_arctica.AAC.1